MSSTTRDVVRADAANSGISPNVNQFLIDFYDDTKLQSSQGSNLTSDNYAQFVVTPSADIAASSIVTGISTSGTVQFGKNGGLTLGTSSKAAASKHTVSFTISDDYKVKKLTLYAASFETGRFLLNDSPADNQSSAKYSAKSGTITNNPLVWDNLSLTTLKFSKDNGSGGTQKRLTIHAILCEFERASSVPYLTFASGAKGIKSVGEKASYPASVVNATGSEGTITYKSSDENIAKVDSKGQVTAMGVGKATITASCEGLTSTSYNLSVYSKNTGLSSNSPLSGEEARDFYNDGVYDPTKSYYVGGYVSKIDGSNYYIDNDSFEFFKCTFDSNSNLDSSTIAVGTYLVGCGTLTAYKGQVEFNAGTIFVIQNKEASSISITGELSTNSTTIYQNALSEWKYADLVVNAIYDDATTADVTTAATWTFDPATPKDVDLGEETQKAVDVTFTAHYNDLVASVTKSITVKKDKATSLSITNQKTEFGIGEYFSIGSGTIKVNHSSNTSVTIGFEDVIVLLGGAEIDVNTYILSASDNGKAVDFKYTENGETVSLTKNTKYTITVNSTLTFTGDMSSLLSGKENATEVTKLNVNDVVTLSASTTGKHKPQSYGDGTEWRLYQNGSSIDATTLTVSLPEYGYELKSVTITYKANNKGTLLLASDTTKKVTSETEIACTGKSISFVVGNTTTDTNGQAQITKVVVKATYDALGTWCDSFLGDLACDPTGRTAPSTDTWATLGNLFLANLTPEMQKYMANYNTSNSKSVVNRALIKYDYIVVKYDTKASAPYVDFIKRVSSGKITLKSNILSIPMEITSSSFAIITFIALASITAIGGYLVIKRRKEN